MKPVVKKILCLSVILMSGIFTAFSQGYERFQHLTDKEMEYALENWIEVPVKYKAKTVHPESYIINSKGSKVETQHGFECGAVSIAYVLRHFGKNAEGIKMYRQKDFPCKFDMGTYPKVFKKYLEPKGYKVNYYTGSVEDLKNCVSKGTPVIVLLQYPDGVLHYVPVVGYDSKYIYIQESVPRYRNDNHPAHNEKRTIEEFKKLWNVPIPYSSNLFVEIKK